MTRKPEGPEGCWWERTLLGLDLETTGTDPLTAVPVSVAFGPVSETGGFDAWVAGLVNPECEIPAEATAVHGITTEAARAGQPRSEVVGVIAEMLCRNAESDRLPVVIYHAPFDWPILLLEAERADVELPGEQAIVDPLLMDRTLEKYRKGSRHLTDVARRWGVVLPPERAHTAGADVVAAVQTARAIARAWGPLPGEGYTAAFSKSDLLFPEFQRYQRELYAAWRDDLNEYWRRSGAREPDGSPRRHIGDWPNGPLDVGH